MTLAALVDRVAPDYARILALLAHAMLPTPDETGAVFEAQDAKAPSRNRNAPPDGSMGREKAPVPDAPSAAIALPLAPAQDQVSSPAKHDQSTSRMPAAATATAAAAPPHASAPAPPRHRLSRAALRRPVTLPSPGPVALTPTAPLPATPLPAASFPGIAPAPPTSHAVPGEQPPAARPPDFSLRLAHTPVPAALARRPALPFPPGSPRARPPGTPLPIVSAWPAPSLLIAQSWPAEPEPPHADPFAEAALEDALSALLERSALAGGLDL